MPREIRVARKVRGPPRAMALHRRAEAVVRHEVREDVRRVVVRRVGQLPRGDHLGRSAFVGHDGDEPRLQVFRHGDAELLVAPGMHGETARAQEVVLCPAENAIHEGDPGPGRDDLPDLRRVFAAAAGTGHRQPDVFPGQRAGPLDHVDDVQDALLRADAAQADDAQGVARRRVGGIFRLVGRRRIEDRVVKVAVEGGQTVVDIS